MKKVNWKILITTTIICILPIILGMVFYKSVPEKVAIHFDVRNNPDSYLNKNIVLFGFPVILGIVQALSCIYNDTKKSLKDYTPRVEYIYKFIIPIISIVLYSITLAIALGTNLDVRRFICFLLGFIFILVGNYIPKTISSYTHGARPKSLFKDEKVWRRINRTMGYTFVILGVLFVISVFFPSQYSVYVVILTIITIIVEMFYFISKTSKEY